MEELEKQGGKRRGWNLGWACGGLRGIGGGAAVAARTGAAAQETARAGAAERSGAVRENIRVDVGGESSGAGGLKDVGRAQQRKGCQWWRRQQEQTQAWRGWERQRI